MPDPANREVFHEPTAKQHIAAKKFINNAFPVSKLDWSVATIDAPRELIDLYPTTGHAEDEVQFALNAAHSRMMGLRAREIEESGSADCIYYGMVPLSGRDYFGVASDVPSTARFDAVALGPSNDRWAHWYAAHEIGHLLGLLHVGRPAICKDFCPKQEGEASLPENFTGQISNSADSLIGVEIDSDSESVRVLHYSNYYDLMTYCPAIWVSNFSFEKLYERIKRLNAKRRPQDTGKQIFISGTFRGLKEGQEKGGAILYAFPISRTPAPRGDHGRTNDQVQIRATYARSRVLYPIPARNDDAHGVNMGSGAFQMAIPQLDEEGNPVEKIELLVWQVGEKRPDDPDDKDAFDYLSIHDGLHSRPSFGDEFQEALNSASGDLKVVVKWSTPPTNTGAFAVKTIVSPDTVEWIAVGVDTELADWMVRIPEHLTNRPAGDFEFVNLKCLGQPSAKE